MDNNKAKKSTLVIDKNTGEILGKIIVKRTKKEPNTSSKEG